MWTVDLTLSLCCKYSGHPPSQWGSTDSSRHGLERGLKWLHPTGRSLLLKTNSLCQCISTDLESLGCCPHCHDGSHQGQWRGVLKGTPKRKIVMLGCVECVVHWFHLSGICFGSVFSSTMSVLPSGVTIVWICWLLSVLAGHLWQCQLTC